jgi:hypothetical protein
MGRHSRGASTGCHFLAEGDGGIEDEDELILAVVDAVAIGWRFEFEAPGLSDGDRGTVGLSAGEAAGAAYAGELSEAIHVGGEADLEGILDGYFGA